MYPAELVSIEGPDAIAFAQAQFSSNLAALADGQWQFSAWLDAQGRVRALFHLLRLDGQRLQLLLRGGGAGVFAAELQRFVFRAKARVSALPPQQLGTVGPLALHVVQEQDDALVLGCGSHGLKITGAGDDDWRLLQVHAGWPWLPRGLPGELLPTSIGLGELGASALDKGCYPGQEIVARLHYRGGHKRHLHRVRLSRMLPPGSVLHENEQVLMQLLDVVQADGHAEALAVVHDEMAARIVAGIDALHEGQQVFVDGIEHAPASIRNVTD